MAERFFVHSGGNKKTRWQYQACIQCQQDVYRQQCSGKIKTKALWTFQTKCFFFSCSACWQAKCWRDYLSFLNVSVFFRLFSTWKKATSIHIISKNILEKKSLFVEIAIGLYYPVTIYWFALTKMLFFHFTKRHNGAKAIAYQTSNNRNSFSISRLVKSCSQYIVMQLNTWA